MDMQDSEAVHSSSESGVQSLKHIGWLAGGCCICTACVGFFAPHTSRSVKYIHWISFGKVVALYCTKRIFFGC